MNSLPQHTLPQQSVPFVLGSCDAAGGELCLPELYFTCCHDQKNYARGYESIAGSTLLSAQILGYASSFGYAESMGW